MKVTKTQALMYILKTLFEEKQLQKEEIVAELELSDIKFHRYMQEIRAFFSNFDIYFELKFSKQYNKYYLVELK